MAPKYSDNQVWVSTKGVWSGYIRIVVYNSSKFFSTKIIFALMKLSFRQLFSGISP